MKRILATITTAILLVGLFSTAAMAAPLTKGNLTVIDKDNFEAQTIEYFKSHNSTIYKDCPQYVTNRTLQSDGTMNYKVDWNIVSHPDMGDDVTHEIVGRGAYITVDNIIRETIKIGGAYSVKDYSAKTGMTKEYITRESGTMLFSKGPVTVTFYGGDVNYLYPLQRNYGNTRSIDKIFGYEIARGSLLYSTSSIERGSKASEEILLEFSDVEDGPHTTTTKVLSEPGMYSIYLQLVDVSAGLSAGPGITLCILDGTEDMNDNIQETVTAIPSTAKVSVNGKAFNVPAYNVNNSNFLKARDIAYILNGTSKQFDVVYSERKFENKVISSNVYLKEFTPYESVGGEMTPLKAGNKTASLTAQTFTSTYTGGMNPLVYSIDGANYLMLRDVGRIIDFSVTYDNATGTVLIDTNKGYDGTAKVISKDAVQADYKVYSVTSSGNHETYTVNGERYWRLRDFAGFNGFPYFGYVHDTDNNTLTIDKKYRILEAPLGIKLDNSPEWATPVSPLVIKGDSQFTLSGYEIRKELYFTIPDIQKIYNFYIEWIADDRYQDGGFYFIDYYPEDGIDRPLFWGTFPGAQ
ncbi:hypothetical protein [Candidatus Formimonas warabiya]|uniref:Uncharacterized protein n=1 Tax=Formimonas warabiya TaxID=1761012 RepID=A0A3G1KT77_FORW1|nr:hypothetical protein [Candidatus Formimonas warabiya]ATW25630.1 hypothetical protein DCMF_13440 [Candidatus Formimonas warabiya]